jgi:peptidoglycan/LPS O-acetylase OafA/YrhL
MAAVQVFISHAHLFHGIAGDIIAFFPGVPIYFTVSGFLITKSLLTSKSLASYFRKRFLRIYPAIWVNTFFLVIIFLAFGVLPLNQYFSKQFIAWFFTENTIFQYWAPDILKEWNADTAPNLPLWTISVEIGFYILLPFIFLCLKKIPSPIKLIVLFFISLLINRQLAIWQKNIITDPVLFHDVLERKVYIFTQFTIFSYLFNFIIGIFMFLFWPKIKSILENKVLFWFLAYCCYCAVFSIVLQKYIPSYNPNFYGLISTILLSVFIISLTFSCKSLARKCLRGIDISYGIYIYHWPVLNIFSKFNDTIGQPLSITLSFISVLLLACASWFFVEKKALGKR